MKQALIFDDDRFGREMLEEIVSMAGFEVKTYNDPLELLSETGSSCYLKSEGPCAEVIITDNQMPGMTGLEFLEHIKKTDCRLDDSRKAIISGSWRKEELDRAQALGCKVFMKPISVTEIHHWLANLPD